MGMTRHYARRERMSTLKTYVIEIILGQGGDGTRTDRERVGAAGLARVADHDHAMGGFNARQGQA